LIKSKEKNPLISYNPEYISETDHVQKNTYDSKNNYFYTSLRLDYYCKWTKMDSKTGIHSPFLV